MNMQALMRQAQAMQKEITKSKEEIDSTEFVGKSSLVTVTVNGKKDVLKVSIDPNAVDLKDDLTLLEDMILVAMSDAFRQVDQMTTEKLGKYSNMMSGLM